MWKRGFYPPGTITLVLGTVMFAQSVQSGKVNWFYLILAVAGAIGVAVQVLGTVLDRRRGK